MTEFSNILSGQTLSVDISNLVSGTYFLTFTDRNNKSFATHKFQVIK